MPSSNTETLLSVVKKCTDVWVPRWFGEFSDNVNGGFHERLGADGQPLPLAKRLLTQCRQILVYSNYTSSRPEAGMDTKIRSSFDFLMNNYRNPQTGGFHFSVDQNSGAVVDAKYDLYGQAFVLLACAAFYGAFKDERALQVAKETLVFVDKFRLQGAPGFAEALDTNLQPVAEMRRQNPNMHMIEASIYMYDASKDPAYMRMADEMLALFQKHLLNKSDMTLREFFADDFSEHPTEGHKVETGHMSEWVWLLQRYQEARGEKSPELIDTMKTLFSWVVKNGFDPEHGGIFNSQSNVDASPTDDAKRIWPVMETMRAASIMQHVGGFREQAQQVVGKTLFLANKYINEDGVWTEFMGRDITPITNYRPGTTPYHIYLPLKETKAYHCG